jgi:hypothetical protein
MARLPATEMVGVPLTSDEATRLLAALDAGALGPVDAPALVTLRRKLLVMKQVAEATERRRG